MRNIINNSSGQTIPETKFEEQLLQNYNFYKSAFELSKDPKLVLEDCVIIRFNPATMSFFECDTPEELFKHEFGEFLPKEFVNTETIKNRCEGNVFIETDILSCKNKWMPVTINFDTIQKNGKMRTIATIHDNSEIIKTRAWLKVKSAAVEAIPAVVIITDISGNILWTNPAFTQQYGYELNEVIGCTPSLLKSGKHTQDFYKSMWDTILSGESWKGKIINKRKDNTEVEDFQVITPVRSRGTEITHFIAVKTSL